MKFSKINLFLLLLTSVLVFPQIAKSQEGSWDNLDFEVNRVHKPLSISAEVLKEAETIGDLNKHYESSWVKEYISVTILTSHDGKIKKVTGKNDILTKEQKDNLKSADFGSDISVMVQYIPDNTLTKNDVKENNFSFTVDPEKEADYIGGNQELRHYLKDIAIDRIPDGSYEIDDLLAINFTVNEVGEIVNVHIFDPIYRKAENEKMDNLLLETIQNMPRWKPAEYTNGTKTSQEFVLTVGNMESCVINLLNIRRDLASRE